MSLRHMHYTVISLLMTGLVMAPAAQADPPAVVQIEVSFLLGALDGSSCVFYRNGAWHDAKTAQAHLRDKYKYLSARNMINSTEEFIEKAASKSSLTGTLYQVKCANAASVSSDDWLRAELARFRAL